MILIDHQCFLMMLSRKIIVRKATLQTTNKLFYLQDDGAVITCPYAGEMHGRAKL